MTADSRLRHDMCDERLASRRRRWYAHPVDDTQRLVMEPLGAGT